MREISLAPFSRTFYFVLFFYDGIFYSCGCRIPTQRGVMRKGNGEECAGFYLTKFSSEYKSVTRDNIENKKKSKRTRRKKNFSYN